VIVDIADDLRDLVAFGSRVVKSDPVGACVRDLAGGEYRREGDGQYDDYDKKIGSSLTALVKGCGTALIIPDLSTEYLCAFFNFTI
jgi:hypothetical protein